MNRRDFIQAGASMPLLGMLPTGLASAANLDHFQHKILLLVELKGANDGLNTLIPYKNPNYYKLRPRLHIKEKDALPLIHNIAMNPHLKDLMPYWKEGQMAWLQGVGYSNQNKSHFYSIDIWETASTLNNETQGWLSRIMPKHAKGVNGIIMGDTNLGPIAGTNGRAVAMSDPGRFLQQTKYLNKQQYKARTNSMRHILDVQNQINMAAQQVQAKLMNGRRPRTQFPNSAFGRKLQQVSTLIVNRMDTPVYKVSLEGFDTHSNQTNQHNNLMYHLGSGLDAFAKSMKEANMWNNVLVMTYSEFGRTAKENASMGTDHGTANNHLVMGGKVHGGRLYGRYPSLVDLEGGDLKYSTDFRQMYATIAQRYWRKPNPWRQHHRPLPFV